MRASKQWALVASSRSRALARTWAFVGCVGLAVLTTQCTFGGLDTYSSEYGEGGRDVGSGGAAGAGGSIAMGGGMPDAGVCECGAAEVCVLGQCETCIPTWTYDHKALRQGDVILLNHHYDASRKTIYVTSTRQDGQGPRRGYLAEVSSCRGTKLREFDGPTAADGTVVPGIQAIGRSENLLYAKLLFDDSTKLAGFSVYDMQSSTFLRNVWFDVWDPLAGYQGAWGLDVAPSGNVWMFGDYSLTDPSQPYPLLMLSDGMSKTCVFDYPNTVGNGRQIATSGNDVYLSVATAAPSPQVRILHYDDSKCDLSLCNCPMVDELPPLVTPGLPSVMSAKVIGSVLVVGGFYVKTNDDFGAFLAQYNFASKMWGSVYDLDPTAFVDSVTAIGSDGSRVYVALVENYAWNDPAQGSMRVFDFSFPITATSQPQTISVPSLRAAFGLDLDGDGMILSGYSSSSVADGRTIRCTMTDCP